MKLTEGSFRFSTPNGVQPREYSTGHDDPPRSGLEIGATALAALVLLGSLPWLAAYSHSRSVGTRLSAHLQNAVAIVRSIPEPLVDGNRRPGDIGASRVRSIQRVAG